ncbi:polysaccharide deacetylase family protein [Aquibacillus koreensis]|uniref:Polysaccharide deacetylase family protein n=1 Tax=Aquibacillus koreensis TaxID=279446 RepID=A0A9X3WM65_9BACI|nr:polysaccharide deacetylase family protein [Aquibacillus koreensis]MCT2536669.1 polysaccharide deacetylase family protein [Aquibacillus koreensis]MDC3422622.1 polysaccharide deacetylase family protein [Aquibacillus koreensis]
MSYIFKKKHILLGLVFFILFASLSMSQNVVQATEQTKDVNVLIVYSPQGDDRDLQKTRILDLLIGHFTSNTLIMPIDQVTEADVRKASHIFYYSSAPTTVPKVFQQWLNRYDGTVVALGYNVDQLGERFSFATPINNEVFSRLKIKDREDTATNILPHTVLNTEVSDEASILLEASHGDNGSYPLFVKHNASYYYAATGLGPPISPFLAEVLHEVFDTEHETKHQGYLRLEDIHPLADPDKIMEIAKELKARNIPYMVAVIPVYIHPENQKRYHFSDVPELLDALKFMQDNGASIVLHGYTHQFRDSETGEGFEFWDVKNNMPIYHTAEEQEVVKKTEDDFDSKEAYEQYRQEQIDFETAYIRDKINSGVQELANYGLYPLAFEAPHYTMSQNGYAVASEFFSTYVGQVQISDENWEAMTVVPYRTSPTSFKGMELLPETIGFVDDEPNAIQEMIQKAEHQAVVRDGMIAGFYHPYLDMENFYSLINELEKLDIEWIDLKQGTRTVQADNVEIRTVNGEIVVDIDRFGLFTSSWAYIGYHVDRLMLNITWVMVGSGGFALILFLSYTIISSKRTRKYRRYRRRGYVG